MKIYLMVFFVFCSAQAWAISATVSGNQRSVTKSPTGLFLEYQYFTKASVIAPWELIKSKRFCFGTEGESCKDGIQKTVFILVIPDSPEELATEKEFSYGVRFSDLKGPGVPTVHFVTSVKTQVGDVPTAPALPAFQTGSGVYKIEDWVETQAQEKVNRFSKLRVRVTSGPE